MLPIYNSNTTAPTSAVPHHLRPNAVEDYVFKPNNNDKSPRPLASRFVVLMWVVGVFIALALVAASIVMLITSPSFGSMDSISANNNTVGIPDPIIDPSVGEHPGDGGSIPGNEDNEKHNLKSGEIGPEVMLSVGGASMLVLIASLVVAVMKRRRDSLSSASSVSTAEPSSPGSFSGDGIHMQQMQQHPHNGGGVSSGSMTGSDGEDGPNSKMRRLDVGNGFGGPQHNVDIDTGLETRIHMMNTGMNGQQISYGAPQQDLMDVKVEHTAAFHQYEQQQHMQPQHEQANHRRTKSRGTSGVNFYYQCVPEGNGKLLALPMGVPMVFNSFRRSFFFSLVLTPSSGTCHGISGNRDPTMENHPIKGETLSSSSSTFVDSFIRTKDSVISIRPESVAKHALLKNGQARVVDVDTDASGLHTEYVVVPTSVQSNGSINSGGTFGANQQRFRELDIDAKACSKSKTSCALGWDDHFRSPNYVRSIKELWATVSVRCHQCEQLVATANMQTHPYGSHGNQQQQHQEIIIAQADIKCFRKRRMTKAEKQANLRKRIYGGCAFSTLDEQGNARNVIQDRKFPHVSKYLEQQMKVHLKHVHLAGKDPKQSSRDLKLTEMRFEALLKEHERPASTNTTTQINPISPGTFNTTEQDRSNDVTLTNINGYDCNGHMHGVAQQGFLVARNQGPACHEEPAWLAMGGSSPSEAASSAPASPGDIHLHHVSPTLSDTAPPSPITPVSGGFASAAVAAAAVVPDLRASIRSGMGENVYFYSDSNNSNNNNDNNNISNNNYNSKVSQYTVVDQSSIMQQKSVDKTAQFVQCPDSYQGQTGNKLVQGLYPLGASLDPQADDPYGPITGPEYGHHNHHHHSYDSTATYHSNNSSRTNSTHQALSNEDEYNNNNNNSNNSNHNNQRSPYASHSVLPADHVAAAHAAYTAAVAAAAVAVDEFRPLQLQPDFYNNNNDKNNYNYELFEHDPTICSADVDEDLLMALAPEGNEGIELGDVNVDGSHVEQHVEQRHYLNSNAGGVSQESTQDDEMMFREMGQLLF